MQTTYEHAVTCPTCNRAGLPTPWPFYVPGHDVPGTETRCENSDKGSKPNYSKDRRKQLCFKCGKYVSRNARFCPRCTP